MQIGSNNLLQFRTKKKPSTINATRFHFLAINSTIT